MITTPRAEYLELEELRRVQEDLWKKQSRYVATHSAFYRQYFNNLTLSGSVGEIASLPFTDKEMLRADQKAHPPFGSYIAASDRSITRLHRTSGTTGSAMNLALTRQDAIMAATIGARAQSASGLGREHRVVHCLNYQLWMGGYTDHTTLEATGAMVVPFGVGNTERLVKLIQELNINAISCTPSYPAVLEQVIKKSFPGLVPKDLGLELGLFGGEPGLDDSVFRNRLEETWGFKARNANYGVTDVMCNFAGQSTDDPDLHFMALDVLFPELIDSTTGNLKPWKSGETGELVLTHLSKQAQPLVRFRTGDIITLTGLGKARCGRTTPRFRVTGRTDDMIVVRGINIFPTQVSAVMNQVSGLSGEFRIVLKTPPPHDFLPLELELTQSIDPSQTDGLISTSQKAIKQHLGVTARVKLMAPESLPRTEGKTRRLIREY